MLKIIPTPIGNLGDITERSLNSLKECDFIIAENPAHTGLLLQKFSIKKPITQLADHNEVKILPKIIEMLKKQQGCLVSDAGTPTISDPGFKLVRACIQNGIEISALPGPMAGITALSASGLPTDKFIFFGFLPKSEKKLLDALKESEKLEATAIIYESPQRILKTLGSISKYNANAQTVVAREITKLHEEYIRGSSQEVFELLNNKPVIKGEIVLLISFK